MIIKGSNEDSIVYKALRKIAFGNPVEVQTFVYFPGNEDEHPVLVKWWPTEGGEGDFEVSETDGSPLPPEVQLRLDSDPEAMRSLKENVMDKASEQHAEQKSIELENKAVGQELRSDEERERRLL